MKLHMVVVAKKCRKIVSWRIYGGEKTHRLVTFYLFTTIGENHLAKKLSYQMAIATEMIRSNLLENKTHQLLITTTTNTCK